MSTLPQPSLFSWREVEPSCEIQRLTRLLQVLPDEPLLAAMEAGRRGKRNDYPLAAMWRALLAAIVYGHESLISCSRELARNGQLLELCGFDPLRGDKAAPPSWVWTRFIAIVLRHMDLVQALFDQVVDELGELLPDLGRELAIDGKAIGAWSRSDPEASEGFKNYEGEDETGRPLQQVKQWFGYKLHLLIDANYELPLGFELSGAKEHESPYLMPIVEQLAERHPQLHERARTLAADRGYDDGADKAALYDEHAVAPLIDTRDQHQGRMQPLEPEHSDTIYFSPTGEVCCKVAPFEPEEAKRFATMQFMGFEAERQTLKFRCPAAAFGLECRNRDACRCAPAVRDGDYGRIVRVPLERDRRIFLPIHRHSRRFEQGYKKRTAVERVNSRIDQVYRFERHFIRGRKKVRLRLSLGLLTMVGTALAWIRAGKIDKARSLVQAA